MKNKLDALAAKIGADQPAVADGMSRRLFAKKVMGVASALAGVKAVAPEGASAASTLYVKSTTNLRQYPNLSSAVVGSVPCGGPYPWFQYKNEDGGWACGGCSGTICHNVWWYYQSSTRQGWFHGSQASWSAGDACYC